MTLQTSISWLDRELEGRRSCYVKCSNNRMRYKILARAVSYSSRQGDTLLLSFTDQRKGFWSFDFNQLLGDCRALSGLQKLKRNLQIERIDTMGYPEDSSWTDILGKEYNTVIGDRVTNLKTGNMEKYSALDRTAEKLESLQEESPLLILDKNPVYRELAEKLDAVMELEREEKGLSKRIHTEEKSFEESIETGQQRKITEYARVPVKG